MLDKRCCRLSKGVEINLDIAMRYVFGDYLLDTQRYELSYRNQPIKLRPKVFHVLSYLIAHRDRVVSKDELLEQVWPNQFIGDGSLNACLMAVRKAVGDNGKVQHCIQTLHGRGYRFIAAAVSSPTQGAAAVERKAAIGPDHPALAALMALCRGDTALADLICGVAATLQRERLVLDDS